MQYRKFPNCQYIYFHNVNSCEAALRSIIKRDFMARKKEPRHKPQPFG